jgi:hypothetical protein
VTDVGGPGCTTEVRKEGLFLSEANFEAPQCSYKVLRRIFGPRRDEVTGGCRKLHNEELRDWYSAPGIRVIKIIKSRG